MKTNVTRISKYIPRIKMFKKWCADKNILHLGCSSGTYIHDRIKRGTFLHSILSESSKSISGLDIDSNSLEVMKTHGFSDLYEGNAEKLSEANINKEFDIVIAGDLLEHITCPGAMLEGVKDLLNEDGKLIISTNNAFGLHYQIRRWLGRYTEHFEHVCFYSPETLIHLFERHNYIIEELYGAYTVPPHTIKQKIVFSIGKPLFQLFPVLAGTLVVVAKPIKNIQ
ncbi:MAG: class I SAM-dependent methyltransferase [Gammaproteobacteria bacterium]|nr:class I SAM-dependent methyltransferase [Gammaproteobacteria bacterium]